MSDAHQIEMFPTALRLIRTDAERNTRWFFLLSVQRDLFGRAALVKEWGQVGSRGQIVRVRFSDEGQAVDALESVAKQMQHRGYAVSCRNCAGTGPK